VDRWGCFYRIRILTQFKLILQFFSSSLKKFKIFFFLLSIYSAQSIYNGNVVFNYDGTEDGYFNSLTQDSISSGISFNQNIADTSTLFIASISEQENNEFDLFLAIIRDTTSPMLPRTWSIPGEGNEENPTSLETLLIFMPGLDSSFVIELFDAFTDTSSEEDSTDVFSVIFDSLSNDIYLGLSGELEIFEINDTLILGTFNTVMIKPAFYFPPHTITINDAEFEFYNPILEELTVRKKEIFDDKILSYRTYPNPFNSQIKIEVSITKQIKDVSLFIYDIKGRLLESIFIGPLEKGIKSFIWDSQKNPSGVYFSVLETTNQVITRKILLVK